MDLLHLLIMRETIALGLPYSRRFRRKARKRPARPGNHVFELDSKKVDQYTKGWVFFFDQDVDA
jgi:hypothetical protein